MIVTTLKEPPGWQVLGLAGAAVNLRVIKPSSIKLEFEVCISQKIRG